MFLFKFLLNLFDHNIILQFHKEKLKTRILDQEHVSTISKFYVTNSRKVRFCKCDDNKANLAIGAKLLMVVSISTGFNGILERLLKIDLN